MSTTYTHEEVERTESLGILQPAGAFSYVEIRAPGHVIVHGYELDLRGHDHTQGKKLISVDENDFTPPLAQTYIQVSLTKHETGDYEVEALERADADSSTDTIYQDSDLPAYPIWPTGETQAPQEITVSHPQNVPPVPRETLDSWQGRMKDRIGKIADELTKNLNGIHHLPHIEVKENNVCLDLQKHVAKVGESLTQAQIDENTAIDLAILKYDNTTNWGRVWVGHCWKILTEITDATDTDKVRSDTEAEIDLLDAEMKVSPVRFYHNHNPTMWENWLKNANGSNNRKVYRVNTDTKPWGRRGGTTRYQAADAADWTALIKTHYKAAQAHDIEE